MNTCERPVSVASGNETPGRRPGSAPAAAKLLAREASDAAPCEHHNVTSESSAQRERLTNSLKQVTPRRSILAKHSLSLQGICCSLGSSSFLAPADPYVAYYYANRNLNPRLPPPSRQVAAVAGWDASWEEGDEMQAHEAALNKMLALDTNAEVDVSQVRDNHTAFSRTPFGAAQRHDVRSGSPDFSGLKERRFSCVATNISPTAARQCMLGSIFDAGVERSKSLLNCLPGLQTTLSSESSNDTNSLIEAALSGSFQLNCRSSSSCALSSKDQANELAAALVSAIAQSELRREQQQCTAGSAAAAVQAQADLYPRLSAATPSQNQYCDTRSAERHDNLVQPGLSALQAAIAMQAGGPALPVMDPMLSSTVFPPNANSMAAFASMQGFHMQSMMPQACGLVPGLGMVPGMTGTRLPAEPSVPCVSPAEYAALYHHYQMSAQAAAASGMGPDPFYLSNGPAHLPGSMMYNAQNGYAEPTALRGLLHDNGGHHNGGFTQTMSPWHPPAAPRQVNHQGAQPNFQSNLPGSHSVCQYKHVRGSASVLLLNDLKNGKGAHLQLADLTGHIAELSLDQHGSRFVQQKLETAPKELIAAVLLELVPSGISLMTDVFGNYVMQKLLEFGTYEHHQLMAGMMRGQVLALSMQMYGCRVVQRALEVFDPDMQCALVAELDGAVMKCVRDQSGNHVIQKVIECVPTSRILPLLDNFLPCVIPLATHPFGCRIIQRLLEFCSDKHRKDAILREVLSEVVQLAQDTYGNYVIQHVLERGSPEERSQASGPLCVREPVREPVSPITVIDPTAACYIAQIVHSLVPCVVPLSMHKFASNVIEKSLAHSSDSDRCLLVNALLDSDATHLTARQSSDESGPLGPLERLMRDQFGNYVIQRLLEVCNDEQRDVLLERVRDQLQTLKRFTYGKHIVARMEKLLSTGTKIQSHLRTRTLPDDSASLGSLVLPSKQSQQPTQHSVGSTPRMPPPPPVTPRVPVAMPLANTAANCANADVASIQLNSSSTATAAHFTEPAVPEATKTWAGPHAIPRNLQPYSAVHNTLTGMLAPDASCPSGSTHLSVLKTHVSLGKPPLDVSALGPAGCLIGASQALQGCFEVGTDVGPIARGTARGRSVTRTHNWKTFGPSSSYSDGDADYFRTTDRLTHQYDWFGPKQPQREEPEEVPSKTLSSRSFLRGDKIDPSHFGYNTSNMAGFTMAARGRSYQGARSAYGDYQTYPEGRPLFLPEAERFGTPPDLPSLLLQQRIIYISMPFLPSVTELVVAQCYYLDFDDKNRNKPIYVYLNSTGCINDKGQAISADNEFYAIWAALGFTRAPLYTGVTWKAQNQAAVLLSAGTKGHRYTFPHAKISTAPPILNRVFGQTVDAQLQSNELEYATKYYAAILARSTGKPLAQCQEEFLSRKRYFSVKKAYEAGLVDKLVPGYSLNRDRLYGNDAPLAHQRMQVPQDAARYVWRAGVRGPGATTLHLQARCGIGSKLVMHATRKTCKAAAVVVTGGFAWHLRELMQVSLARSASKDWAGPSRTRHAVSVRAGEVATMLTMYAPPSLLRRVANHSQASRTGAVSRRDNSKALTTTQRATGNADTLCTLHAPLLNTLGLVADCDGYAITCCVEEEGEGWVVKRSKTGAGFATMFRLGENDKPTAFAADPEGTIAVAEDNLITTYDFEGNMRDHVAVQGTINCMACLSDGRLIFIADDTMYMANLRAEIEDDFVMVFVAKQLVSHVKPSGGLALFPAAKKLLFISSRNSLCQLDIESKESRVITESMEAGRLCTGTDNRFTEWHHSLGEDRSLALSCSEVETMLAANAASSLLRRASNHRAARRKGAGSDYRRDHSRALTTTQRATANAETLCTLHAPLLNTLGLVAECDGYAITCCVEEESKGWALKRSKTGAGFATMFRFDSVDNFKPSAFAADPKGTIAVADRGSILIFDDEGNMHGFVPVEGTIDCMACLNDGRLIFIADDTMYKMNLRVAIEDDFIMEELVSHVKPSGGLALMHAAKKLLFISSRNSLCQLDIESKESRVITESMSLAGRLCSGTDKSALFISPTSSGSLYLTPCSMEGILDLERKIMLPATTTDCCVNSQGGLLMLEKPGNDKLARLFTSLDTKPDCLAACIAPRFAHPAPATPTTRLTAISSCLDKPIFCQLVSPETLSTLHAPLLKSRGLVADCAGYAVTCCVEEEGEGWVVKRSKTGEGFARLFGLDFQPTAFAVASSGMILVAAPGFINMFDSEGTAETVTVPGEDTAA
ncbi:hypothetical protein QJQ45_022659 [Haematococcus lacustris]|nr:hypothetical protein QJQ45_022659 [Haematococcus lacustris]